MSINYANSTLKQDAQSFKDKFKEILIMKQVLGKGQFTMIGPDEIWKLYNSLQGIFRGGGNTNSPKLARSDGPRKTDLHIIFDPIAEQEMVHPDKTKGLSFADNI